MSATWTSSLVSYKTASCVDIQSQDGIGGTKPDMLGIGVGVNSGKGKRETE